MDYTAKLIPTYGFLLINTNAALRKALMHILWEDAFTGITGPEGHMIFLQEHSYFAGNLFNY